MSTNNEELREAWTYLIDVWPADSKSMNRLALARETLAAAIAAASKPEPQAQAGEPEVVAHLWECLGRWSAYLASNGGSSNLAPPDWLVKAVNAATNREAIAKKDAALKACVEALNVVDANNESYVGERTVAAAITQAQEAQR